MTLMLWYQHSTLESSTDFMSCLPEKRGNAFVDYFQASLNYGPQVAYWPIPNIEITSNPDINK